MASSNLGSLVVSIEANLAKFESDLGRGVRMAESAVSKISGFFNALGVAIGGGGLAAGFAGMIRHTSQLGDELTKGASRAGIATTEFSKLAAVAKASDVDLTSLEKGIKQYQVAISSAADGNKEASKAFYQLGLDIKALRGLDAAKQFTLIAEALRNVQDPTDRTRLGTELLGRAYLDLAPLLEKGAHGINAMVHEQERLGAVLTAEQIKRLDDEDGAIKRMTASFSALATELGARVAPAMSGFFDAITGVLRSDPNGLEGLRNQYKSIENGYDEAAKAALRLKIAAAEALQSQKQAALAQEAIEEQAAALQKEAIAARLAADEQARLARMRAAASQAGTRFTVFAELKENIKWLEAYEKASRDAEETTRTSVEEQSAAWADFNRKLEAAVQSGLITQAEAVKRYKEQIDQTLGEFTPSVHLMVKETKKATDQMSQFAIEAARNMQDAFANFLFDPFHGGLRTMLLDFIQVIQRMVAEAAASKIFDSLFGSASSGGGLAGFFGKLFSVGAGVAGGAGLTEFGPGDLSALAGARASGGPVSAGRAYLVGERGPETFVPSIAGNIVANGGGGPVVHYAPVINIDSRSDRAQVQADTARLVRQGNRDLLLLLQRNNPGLRA